MCPAKMAKGVEVVEEGIFSAKDYEDPLSAPLIDPKELGSWSFYRPLIANLPPTNAAALAFSASTGGHINPAVTFGLFLARKVSLIRAVMYMVAQCAGAICGVGLVKLFQSSSYETHKGGANMLAPGYNKGTGLGAEMIRTSVLVYTVFSAADPKRSARDSHVPLEIIDAATSWLRWVFVDLEIRIGTRALVFHVFFLQK
ncbi:unnamed protein product [Camellia sinensis]